jgi:hypothetical protein
MGMFLCIRQVHQNLVLINDIKTGFLLISLLMCSANCTAAGDSSSLSSSSKMYSSSMSVLTNDCCETLGVVLLNVEDDGKGEIGK